MKLTTTLLFAFSLCPFMSTAQAEVPSYEGLDDISILQMENDEILKIESLMSTTENKDAEVFDTDRRRRRFLCVSKNFRGRRFVSVAKRRGQARRRALRKCRFQSRPAIALTCKVRRCRRIGRRSRF